MWSISSPKAVFHGVAVYLVSVPLLNQGDDAMILMICLRATHSCPIYPKFPVPFAINPSTCFHLNRLIQPSVAMDDPFNVVKEYGHSSLLLCLVSNYLEMSFVS
jgi:hypothetical protein